MISPIGPGIGRPVAQPAGTPVHRAGVHAGSAADAFQRGPELLHAEPLGAAIVDKHDMHFAALARAAEVRGVLGDRASRARCATTSGRRPPGLPISVSASRFRPKRYGGSGHWRKDRRCLRWCRRRPRRFRRPGNWRRSCRRRRSGSVDGSRRAGLRPGDADHHFRDRYPMVAANTFATSDRSLWTAGTTTWLGSSSSSC